jgi:hypothetical protein
MRWTNRQEPTWATIVALTVLYACGGASTGDGGGNDSNGGANASGGAGGASSGVGGASSGVGGASSGVAGSPGGVTGVGGSPESPCPAVLTMSCESDGISCLYDAWTQCLCTVPMVDDQGRAFDCMVVDTRCPSGPIAGSTHGPVANTPKACNCVNGTFSCDPP